MCNGIKILSMLFLLLPTLGLYAQNEHSEFEGLKIEENLGEQLPLDEIMLRGEDDQERSLASYFEDEKPVILSPVYYNCPSLCSLVMNGIVNALRRIDWTAGEEFKVLFVSIDPSERAEVAQQKKQSYMKAYGRPGTEDGWKFLTGSEAEIKELTNKLGFGYRYIEETGEYAHGAGFFVLSPSGKISRVLFGVEFKPRDLKLALVEASEGKVGNFVDQVLLYCFRYDPDSKGYGLYAFRLIQAGGAFTVLVLGLYLFWFWRRERRKASSA